MTHSTTHWTHWSREWPVWWTASTPQSPRKGRRKRQEWALRTPCDGGNIRYNSLLSPHSGQQDHLDEKPTTLTGNHGRQALVSLTALTLDGNLWWGMCSNVLMVLFLLEMAHSHSSPVLSAAASTKVLYYTDRSLTPFLVNIPKRWLQEWHRGLI